MFAQFKAARLAKGWTQKQLAYFSGLSIDMIRKLEHGRTNPRMNSLVSLARALNCELELMLKQARKA